MSQSVLLRATIIVVGLAAMAWLAASLRAVDLVTGAEAVVKRAQSGRIAPEEVRHGRELLDRARRFNADLDPQLREGFLLLLTSENAAALATASDGVRREPENFDAWYLVYLAAQASNDRDEAAGARQRIDELNPLAVDQLDSRLSEGS